MLIQDSKMLRYCTVLVSVAVFVHAGYPDGYSGNDIGNGGGSSNSHGYGYSGSFSGSGPIPNNIQFEVERNVNQYIGSVAKFYENFFNRFQSAFGGQAFGGGGVGGGGYGVFGNGPGSTYGAGFGVAQPSIPVATFQPVTGGSYGGSFGSGTGGAFGGSFAGPSGPANGASASAFYGPGGIQQTAAVFPENPNVPNINTRFGASGQPDGFYSVSTSSQSHTSNLNGKPVTVNRASTTVNDNGKVTTYIANNP